MALKVSSNLFPGTDLLTALWSVFCTQCEERLSGDKWPFLSYPGLNQASDPHAEIGLQVFVSFICIAKPEPEPDQESYRPFYPNTCSSLRKQMKEKTIEPRAEVRSGEIWLPLQPSSSSASFVALSGCHRRGSRGLRKPSPPSCPWALFSPCLLAAWVLQTKHDGHRVGMGILLCPPPGTEAAGVESGVLAL